MDILSFIKRKRDGQIHQVKEISSFISALTKNELADYQISSWLMAAFLKGLNDEECFALTLAMKDSGSTLDWPKIDPKYKEEIFVDKHSTGGVGDKVSIILAPLLSCFGLYVPMMSGRSLGHTGGTVDKLESIPAFNIFPSTEKMLECLDQNKIIMMAQAKDLCPADKKLYALRDTSCTVESIPLICASILSKKWAEGISTLLFDVKCGEGAFMQNKEDAKKLASTLVNVAKKAKINAKALITRMEEPLGYAIGNSLEIKESYDILKGEYESTEQKELSKPLKELCLEQAAQLAVLAGRESSKAAALQKANSFLENGEALMAFQKMLKLQGAQDNWLEKLPQAKQKIEIKAKADGFLSKIHSRQIGEFGLYLGVGRQSQNSLIDPSCGLSLHKRISQAVKKGEVLASVHYNNPAQIERLKDYEDKIFELSESAVSEASALVLEEIS